MPNPPLTEPMTLRTDRFDNVPHVKGALASPLSPPAPMVMERLTAVMTLWTPRPATSYATGSTLVRLVPPHLKSRA